MIGVLVVEWTNSATSQIKQKEQMKTTQIHPRQIAKVAYEAVRHYGETISENAPSWESAKEEDRDAAILKVENILNGVPATGATIRPSDQVKAEIFNGVVGAFYKVHTPVRAVGIAPAPEPVPVPIPVEVFPNPDEEAAAPVEYALADGSTAPPTQGEPGSAEWAEPATEPQTSDPQTVHEALAIADERAKDQQ